MKPFNREQLEKSAFEARSRIIKTIVRNGEGHAGGALSVMDIISVLYEAIMDFDPNNPIDRDKLILSAGHKCLALYSGLAGLGVIDESVFLTYNELNSNVPGHPDASKLPGIDFSTGSLGHGLPLGCGYALAARMQGKAYKTYVIMGDGEQGEGSNWEAAAFAAHNRLDNLIAVIDENTLQINACTKDICYPSSFEDRYRAFGWSVTSIDGHDVGQIYDSLSKAPFEEGKPSLIVAKTIKGKGLSMLEGDLRYHHWHPNAEQGKAALDELSEKEMRWS
ncbi:MAG: transketolase [Christensenellales bacterium]|jgi:transketolase